jgi:hypothetical protein
MEASLSGGLTLSSTEVSLLHSGRNRKQDPLRRQVCCANDLEYESPRKACFKPWLLR